MRRRTETLAARVLDPNVSQEVLKLTIAYKAETNVVDIVALIRQSLDRQLEGES
jgi:predicted transport protein